MICFCLDRARTGARPQFSLTALSFFLPTFFVQLGWAGLAARLRRLGDTSAPAAAAAAAASCPAATDRQPQSRSARWRADFPFSFSFFSTLLLLESVVHSAEPATADDQTTPAAGCCSALLFVCLNLSERRQSQAASKQFNRYSILSSDLIDIMSACLEAPHAYDTPLGVDA